MSLRIHGIAHKRGEWVARQAWRNPKEKFAIVRKHLGQDLVKLRVLNALLDSGKFQIVFVDMRVCLSMLFDSSPEHVALLGHP